MDAFWTVKEAAFRRAAREHFGREDGHGLPPAPEVPPELGLGGWAAVAEEASLRDPKSGRAMGQPPGGAVPSGPAATAVLDCSRLAGMAAHVLAAGIRAARDRGAFSSSLMGCREIQESLAALVSGAELMRLGACRLCRLLDRSEGERAEAEALRLLAVARALAGEVRAVACSLLGTAWVAENLPEEDIPPPDERTTR
jgi:hypothetical protein